jgi:hypothetical protein
MARFLPLRLARAADRINVAKVNDANGVPANDYEE